MTDDEFAVRYPRVYHVAEAGSWAGIARHGLLSTSALLDLLVGRHADGFATERDARFDAEQLREQLATAPIIGEVDEATGEPAR